jgi:hypothetical protein
VLKKQIVISDTGRCLTFEFVLCSFALAFVCFLIQTSSGLSKIRRVQEETSIYDNLAFSSPNLTIDLRHQRVDYGDIEDDTGRNLQIGIILQLFQGWSYIPLFDLLRFSQKRGVVLSDLYRIHHFLALLPFWNCGE